MKSSDNPPIGALTSAWANGQMIFATSEVPGRVFYVDSNTDGTAGTSWSTAVGTIDEAVNLCTASAGDVIFVHPSHAENLAADSAIDIDVAGVTVIGLRQGRLMPTLTATVIAGDCKLAAAGVTIKNLRFLGGVDATTGCIEVSAADCAIIDCEYRDSVDQATDVIITTAAADRLLIDGFRCFGAAAAGANTAIALVGADDCEIKNCYLHGNFALGAIECRTTLSARIDIHDCKIWTTHSNDLAIKDLITNSTGFIGPNLSIMLADNAANITTAVTGATFQMIDPVYIVNLVNEKAMLSNWTASTHG